MSKYTTALDWIDQHFTDKEIALTSFEAKSVMKIPAIAALLLSLLAFPGCIYAPQSWDNGDAIKNVDWNV